MATKSGFTLVGEDDAPIPQTEPQSTHDETSQATAILMLALRTVAQRFIIALSNLLGLLTAASVFWLAMAIRNNPNLGQLVLLGMYAAFILCVNLLKRKE